jgi:predicted enzyme involved in methoxymalonyl-ACP biosynthesis
LNSTGYIYSYDELAGFIESADHEVLITSLVDKYGDYGKIGLALLQKHSHFSLPKDDTLNVKPGLDPTDSESLLVTQNAAEYLRTCNSIWELKLLLMSCRVMSKGVGNVFLSCIVNKARAANAGLLARFLPTDRNRLMYVTYKFNGFTEVAKDGDLVFLSADMSYDRKIPDIVRLIDMCSD